MHPDRAVDPLVEILDDQSAITESWRPTDVVGRSRLREVIPEGMTDDLWWGLFDAAPVAYGLVEVATGHVHANAAAERLFGYGPGGMVGMTVGQLIHPGDEAFESNRALLAEVRATRFEGAKRYVRKDGSVFYARLVASVLREHDGSPQLILAAIEDVTDQINAVERLSETEARFQAMVRHNADGIVLVDADGRLRYATPSAERFTGVAMADAIGRPMLDFVHEEDRQIVAEEFAHAVGVVGTSGPLRLRLMHIDGRPRLVETMTTNLLDDPAVEGLVINLRDITAQAEASTALEMSEARFRHLIENISDTVTLIDADAHVVLSTGNLRSILGFPTDYWKDLNLFELVHPEDVAEMQDSLVELLATPGKEMSGEVRVRNVEGGWIDAEINAVNLLDDPAVQGIVLTTRNITARKQYEVELAAARDQAVRALEMRTEFIASVSHELRTPIHGVLGLAELLVTADLDEESRNLARSISRAADSLRMVLDDILDFSKIEVGRLEINHEPVRPEEIGRDLGALFGAQATAKGISLVIEKPDDFPEWVLADGLRVRQVLNNLVSNAIKFTFEGEVRVTASRDHTAQGPVIRVVVRDSGIGIPESQFDRLFEPFSQAHQRTREFGGTGLGLSIARRLIELMGGELGFTSSIGSGSEFWFTLPLIEASPPPERIIESTHTARGDSTAPTVMVTVVEDNPINQLLVRRQLERLGYGVRVYDSGLAALDGYASDDAAIVLMDWQLPGIDGLETTRRMRAWEHEHDRDPVPIVAMTASALPGDRARCLEAGMDDFIAKPVSLSTLGAVLQRWTTTPAAAASSSSGGVDGSDGSTSPSGGGGTDPGVRGDLIGEREARAAIDRVVLDRLIEELADPVLVVTVARTYLRELAGRFDAIASAMHADDRTALAAAAHTLKSTSAAVGATEVAELSLQLEQTARLSATVPLPVSRARLERAVELARVGLELAIADIDRSLGALAAAHGSGRPSQS